MDIGKDADVHLGAARQAIRGAHQCRLVGEFDWEDIDDAPPKDDDDTIADTLHLLEFGCVEQHRLALVGEFAQQLVNLLLGADIDAARRVEAEDGLCFSGDPAGDRHLLLVAAGQPLHLALGARVDLQPLDRTDDPGSFLRHVGRPPVSQGGAERQRDVFAHRALHGQRFGAVAGHIGDSSADRIRRMREFHRLAVHLDRAAGRPDRAGQRGEQLVLALALKRDDAGDLAVGQVE
ncbi:hypothetical protein MesoLjLa_09220 [Mesorhizobium sp. L-2-11]|nr:hypothetical protein MesoLjLa_09220 [Mesorhizobium sp. L-2-11]